MYYLYLIWFIKNQNRLGFFSNVEIQIFNNKNNCKLFYSSKFLNFLLSNTCIRKINTCVNYSCYFGCYRCNLHKNNKNWFTNICVIMVRNKNFALIFYEHEKLRISYKVSRYLNKNKYNVYLKIYTFSLQ